MSDTSERDIRRVLTALAEAPGVPDEREAWARIGARVTEAEHGRARRRAIVGAGLVCAGAAAALLLAFAVDDPREAVDIGPAAFPTVPLAGFPAEPLAVVVEADDGQRLDLYDAADGRLVTAGLARSVHSISDVSIATNGFLYFTEERGDSSVVRAVPWDGSTEPETPFGADDNDSSSPTLSPDGRQFAFVRQGVTTPQPTVELVDTRSGDRVSVVLGGPDVRLTGLEFSPGGNRLLVLVDGVPNVLPVDDSLGQATPLSGDAVVDAHWSAGDEVVGLVACCAPDFVGSRELFSATLDGPGSFEAAANGVVAFDATPATTFALVRDDGTVVITAGGGDERQIALEDRAVDVGF
jgi:hypothetical protein